MCMFLLALTTLISLQISNAFGVSVLNEEGAEELRPGNFEYYDRIRRSPSLLHSIVYPRYSNVIEVELASSSNGEDEDGRTNYLLAELKVFLPFSNGTHANLNTYNDAGALLLAQHHFNNFGTSNPILFSENVDMGLMKDCNVKLTMELLDSQLSPVASTRVFTEILQEDHTIQHPLPSGVIGAYRSATTSPLSVLTGVNGIPQISASSTSTDFDVKEQFPLFGRTITSSSGEAKSALDFFISIGATHVGVLYITDAYGSSLQKAFQDAANEANIETDSVAFSYSSEPGGKEITNAIAHLKRTRYRLFYAICFESQFRTVIKAAYDQDIIGPGFLWTFPGVQARSFYATDLTGIPADALRGIGFFQIQGGVTYEHILANGEMEEHDPTTALVSEKSSDSSSSGFEKFRVAWREALQNENFTNYVRSKFPERLETLSGFDIDAPFSEDIYPYMPLLYDAVNSLGMSMCKAQDKLKQEQWVLSSLEDDVSYNNETLYFTGEEVYSEFINLDFEGASGRVLISNDTGTRDYRSLTFMMWNTQEYYSSTDTEASDPLFKLVPTGVQKNSTWQAVTKDRPFIFADGTTIPPESLPPVDMEYNFIGNTGRAAGYILMGIVMFLCVCSIIWMVINWNDHVVVSAQPLFLIMVSTGSLIMASSILPLSMEELLTDDIDTLNRACMAAPWLYVCGAVTTLSALLAKTRGIHKAYVNPELDFIHVTSYDIFSTFSFTLILNAIVMMVWTFRNPLEWTRIYKSATDMFDREVESYGTCANDDSVPYVIVVMTMNVTFLVVGNWWAYLSRNIETEYLESRYISISMAAVLQAWCMGIPILIVVWDTPQAKFFVKTGIIFVTALAFLSLIYVPKVLAVIQGRRQAIEEEKRRAYTEFTERQKNREEYEEEEDHKEVDVIENDASEGCSGEDDRFGGILEQTLPDSDVAHGATAAADNNTRSGEFRLSGRFKFQGAMKSDDAKGSVRGIKVVHNPRSESVLSITQGREVRRDQLAQFQVREEGKSSKLNSGVSSKLNSGVSKTDLAKEEMASHPKEVNIPNVVGDGKPKHEEFDSTREFNSRFRVEPTESFSDDKLQKDDSLQLEEAFKEPSEK